MAGWYLFAMKRSRLSVAIVVAVSVIAAPSFAAVKAGAKCTKAGATSTTGGMKYTCVKSGNKLVWNKGVTTKVAVKPAVLPSNSSQPSPSPSRAIETKNFLISDSRITSSKDLTALDICKTTDITSDTSSKGESLFKNGFPRSSQTLSGQKQAKVLVIPMSFKDLPFHTEKVRRGNTTSSDLEILNEVIPRVESAFKELSLGRFEMKIDVLPKSEWWTFSENQPFKFEWGVNNWGSILELISQHKSTFKFEGYDSYIFLSGHGPNGLQSSQIAQGGFDTPMKNSKDGHINTVLMAGRFADSGIWVHELGHSLFGFEDLYLFNDPGKQKSKDIDVPLNWDLMANANKAELLQWNRLLMGWLSDGEVRCLSDQKSTIHYLSEFSGNTDPSLLLINVVPGVTLAAETRGVGSSEKGLLIYMINTYTPHGEGPILAQNSLITKGQSKAMIGWEFMVLDSNSEGTLLSVTKTDVDKFVPPPFKPAPNNSGQSTSQIKPTRGDIVPNGYLKAKATWEVTGHQSYRLYVTDVVDFQKVYFESGYVNDSRSTIVVEITGLECNKQFRTMTEFFREKDGKGERIVMPSLQLRDLPCQDPTKKP